MIRTQLRRSKLGKELSRIVGARKAVKLLQSLYTANICINFNTKSIGMSFVWDDTPQGWGYWNKLYFNQTGG